MGEYRTVADGDCVSSIAAATGHFWETLWNAPENEALAAERGDPNSLARGDRVFVPDLRVKSVDAETGMRHRFRRRGVPCKLVLRLLTAGGEPRKKARYTLTVEGVESPGRTDDDGYLRVAVPPGATRGKLVVKSDDEDEEDEEMVIEIGSLAPHDTIAGAQARLRNLGALSVRVTGELDDLTRQALTAFQRAREIDPTGELDGPTASALRDAHGS